MKDRIISVQSSLKSHPLWVTLNLTKKILESSNEGAGSGNWPSRFYQCSIILVCLLRLYLIIHMVHAIQGLKHKVFLRQLYLINIVPFSKTLIHPCKIYWEPLYTL